MNVLKIFFFPTVLMFCVWPNSVNGGLSAIRDILQMNFIGVPTFYKNQQWAFDPDVAFKRAKQFEELHGVMGEKLIERLGLGIDGMTEKRLIQQKARDEGHLGGLNYLTP